MNEVLFQNDESLFSEYLMKYPEKKRLRKFHVGAKRSWNIHGRKEPLGYFQDDKHIQVP